MQNRAALPRPAPTSHSSSLRPPTPRKALLLGRIDDSLSGRAEVCRRCQAHGISLTSTECTTSSGQLLGLCWLWREQRLMYIWGSQRLRCLLLFAVVFLLLLPSSSLRVRRGNCCRQEGKIAPLSSSTLAKVGGQMSERLRKGSDPRAGTKKSRGTLRSSGEGIY